MCSVRICESQSVTVNCPANNFGPLRPLISKCFYHQERAAADPPLGRGEAVGVESSRI